MRKVAELKGYKSLRALNAHHTLMLGLKMLPAYMGDTYEEFYARVEALPAHEQEKLIREAVLFVELSKEEIEALACFCLDPNGIPYTAENLRSLGVHEIMEIIVAVCVEISKIQITFVSESEKKKLKISR